MIAAKVARGAIVLVAARLVTRTLDLFAMLVVARLLTPEDFGLVALAATVLLVLTAATDISVSAALVQMKDPPRSAYDTAFTLNLARGVVLALLIVAVAYPFAALYADPRLVSLMFALALAPLARGFISPRLAARARELSFREQMTVEVAGKLAAFVASVSVAVALKSHWALIAGMVAAPFLSTAVSYMVAPYRPRLGLEGARGIFAFSGWLTLSNAVNQVNWQIDRLFIGYRLGTAALGQYTVGSELASLPTQAPVQPMMQALFAGLARVAHDKERFRAAYLASQVMVMALALPIGFAVSALATPIVTLALGPGWEDAAFVIALLAPVFALQMLTGPAQAAATAAGETRAILHRDLLAFAVRVPLVLAGLFAFGLAGAVVARIVSGIAVILFNLAVMRRILDASILEQVLAPWRSVVAAVAMLAVLWAGTLAVYPGLDGDIVLEVGYILAATMCGGLVYVAVHAALWLAAGRPDGPERRIAHAVAPYVPARLAGRRERAHG